MEKQERTYCVYKHINKLNGKIYIGITSQQPEKRWKNGRGYEGNEHFYNAIQKYGWDDGFIHEIIASGLTKESACAIEIELIQACDSTNPNNGYNFSIGGDCGNAGCYQSEEWANKMSEALSKSVICIESSVVYKSVKLAEKETGIRASSISAVCNGGYGHQTAGGLHWCFWDEEWNNFKLTCEKLGCGYTSCSKCGILIVQRSNTKPKKYCCTCSKRKPVGIKKKKHTSKKKKSIKKKNIVGRKKQMGKTKPL